MKQILKLVFLLVIGQTAFGQAPSNYTNINGRYRWIAGMFDSTFHIPKGATPSLRTGGSTNSGGLFYNTSDSSVYTYTGTQWIKLRGSINPSDTTNKYVTQVYKKSGSDSIFYVKGGTHTWAFNDSTGSPGGGGGGKVYYFNGGVNMGTIGGLQMYELGDTANTGAAANFTRSTTGNIANFITDPGKPGLVQIPAGVWSVDAWLSETGGGANHAEIWIEVEKWDGSTITTIATSPIEQITEGATPNLYSWSVTIPTTSLAITDRIVIQFYISNTNGKTVTLYTQNGYVGEVHTTFTTGIGAINGLTAPAQYLVTGTSGTDFNINSTTATHTFNLPTASATNRGALSTTDWSTFNNKIGGTLVSGYLTKATGTNTIDTSQIYQSSGLIGIGTTTPAQKLDINGDVLINGLIAGRGTGNINTNAVLGRLAFNFNTTGFQNVAIGNLALYSNTTGANNVAIGNSALSANTTANHNVAIGHNSMLSNTTGFQNTAVGIQSLGQNTTGENNTGIGNGALGVSTTGYENVALGTNAGRYITAGGNNTTSNQSVYIGADTRASANGNTNEIVIGKSAIGNGSNSVTLGNASITKTVLRENVGVGTVSPDSALTVVNGAYFQRGIRASGLPTAPGTKALRINASGTISIADTLANGISGTGTTNYIPKFTSSSAIGNSLLYDNGTNIGIGTTNPTAGRFQINGSDITTAAHFQVIDATTTLANSFVTNFRNANDGNSRYSLSSWQVQNAVGNDQIGFIGVQSVTGAANYSPNMIFGLKSGASSFQEYFRISSTGNVGIGESNPASYKLQVKGPDGQGILYEDANGVKTLLGSYNNKAIVGTLTNNATGFWSNNSEKMLLDASGNLGLGVSPSAWISTSKAFQLGNTAALFNPTSEAILSNNMFVNSADANIYLTTNFATQYRQVNGQHIWYNAPSGTAGNAISFTQAMTLDASGRLKIGNTTNYANEILGVSHTNNAGITTVPAVARFMNSGSGYIPKIILTDNNIADATIAFTPLGAGQSVLSFGIQGISSSYNILNIKEGGNVGIGTTSPGDKLEVNGNVYATAFHAVGSIARFVAGGGVYIAGLNGSSYGTVQSYSDASGTGRILSLNPSGGNVGIGTSSPTQLLSVNGASTFSGNLTVGNSLAVLYNTANTETALFQRSGSYGSVIKLGRAGVSNTTTIDYPADGTFAVSTQGSERMRITSGGELLINTTSDAGDYKLQVNGNSYLNGITKITKSFELPHTTKSAAYTLTSDDYTVGFNVTAASITATLPDATTCAGRTYVIYQYNTGNGARGVTIDGNGAQTINGISTYSLLGWCDYSSVILQSDGSNWIILSDAIQSGCL
jgi:hypothetical protein